jgi:membrane protein YdbS with pleckstrin-like domain
MRVVTVIAVIWLLIGVLAAAQRDYFSGGRNNCAHAARVVVTVIAGPLNYMGVNPKPECNPPQPSK